MISLIEAKARAAAGGSISKAELDLLNQSAGPMTAEDWHTILHACPEWVAEQEERSTARESFASQLRDEEAPLLADLSRAGLHVTSVWDLVKSARSYDSALPVLTQHLLRSYHFRIREGITRALTVPEARGIAGSAFVSVLRERDLDPQLRWPLVNALSVTADANILEDLKFLLQDETDEDIKKALRSAIKRALKTP